MGYDVSRRTAERQDTRRSWLIAVSCCFLNCLLYGVARLSGMLMVATLEYFRVSRASAALPFSVSTSMRNLSGIFVGYLGDKFGLRATIATGSVLAFLGAGLCFFATNIQWMVVCWGGIFGLGFGLTTCLLPLAINQHFNKYRGTASGISYSGSYLGSFIFPPLVVELLNHYGLPGTFLVISAIFLNGLAVSTLFSVRKMKNEDLHENSISQDRISIVDEKPNKNVWIRFWHKVKSKCTILNGKMYQNASHRSSIFFIDSLSNNNTAAEKCDIPYCVLVSYTDSSFANVNPNYELQKSRTISFCSPISYAQVSKRTPFKKNCVKLKRYLGRCLIKKRYPLGQKCLECCNDNVRLISFKKLNRKIPCIKKIPKRCSMCNVLKNRRYLFFKKYGKERKTVSKEYLTDKKELKEVYEKSQSHILEQKNDEINYSIDPMVPYSNPRIMNESVNQFHPNQEAYSLPNLTTESISEIMNNNTMFIGNTKNLKSLPEIESSSKGTFDPKESNIAPSAVLKNSYKCMFGWFRLYSEPMFVVIAITISLHTFVMVCMITIIEDFAKDIGIPACSVHYVLMVLSTADLVGSLTLGIITDRGILSRTNFIMVCLLGMSVCQISISYSRSYTSLLSTVAAYGVLESGVIITLPLLIDLYIPRKKQAVAVASSNILSSPTVLLVPLVIGYFRDQKGCYSGVFYCLGATSLFCSLIWLIAPQFLAKPHNKPKFILHDIIPTTSKFTVVNIKSSRKR